MRLSLRQYLTVILALVFFGWLFGEIVFWLFRNYQLPFLLGRINLIGLYTSALCLIALIVFKLIEGRRWIALGFNKFSRRDLRCVGYGLVLIYPIFLAGRIFSPTFDRWYVQTQQLFNWSAWSAFLLSVLLLIFTEELVQRFIQARVSVAIGVALTPPLMALNFTIFHYSPGFGPHLWPMLISVFLSALVLAAVYEQTKNFWLALFFHAVFNALSLLQIFFHGQGWRLAEIGWWTIYGLVVVLTLRPSLLWFFRFWRGKLQLSVLEGIVLIIILLGLPVILMLFR